ncbi:MAG: hypothetical protein IIC73_08430 [Armatimonadetes bacterium]|nr:hypothetical protein [Armatimonadota bacterium]
MRSEGSWPALTSMGWRVYGHDFNHVSLAPSPSSVALSADDSCQLILGTLTETKKNKRYRYDPRINRLGEITIRELRTWIAMRGASEEQFALPFCALLARNRVRVVPTCPDADLSLLSATSAGLRGKISSLQPDPHLVESVILRHLESAEEDAYQRAYRIPDVASRELATTLLEANNGPQHGVTLADLTSFIERVFPQITIEPRRTPKKADFFEIPAQVLDAISRVTSVTFSEDDDGIAKLSR